MSLINLVKLKTGSWSYGQALSPSRHCRLDPSSSEHGAVVDERGILHYFHMEVASSTTTELLTFQLQFRASNDAPSEPINKPWKFEFVPGLPGELLLVQPGSARILYASLPRQDVDASDVFLFGSHTAPVTCIANNGNIALSGCDSGVLKLWGMADGQLTDSVPLYADAPAAVTAINCLGPLLVAAGNSAGAVTLYDIASGRLLAVQRLQAGEGPVTCLTSWLDSELLSAAVLAAPGPRVPDGGGVLPGPDVGIPWRQQDQQDHPHGRISPPAALLACCSSSGWLRIYQASQSGPKSWELLHTSHGILGSPITALSFSPRGDTVAVASPAVQILGTEAVAVAAAGGQPGALSLYSIARDAGLQQGLKLWRQWSLRSVPVDLLMLPSSHLDYVHDKQLQPTEVLHMLVMPELGPGHVLTAEKSLSSRSSSEHRPQQLQQQQSPGQTLLAGVNQMQQQMGQAVTVSPAADVQRLDIAERDWSAVADAIQGATPLQESDLVTMLEDLIAETGDLLGSTDLESQTQRRLQQRQHQQPEQQLDPAEAAAVAGKQTAMEALQPASGARKQLFIASSRTVSQPTDLLHQASLQASGVFDQGLTIVDQGWTMLDQGPGPLEGGQAGVDQAVSHGSDQLESQRLRELHEQQHNQRPDWTTEQVYAGAEDNVDRGAMSNAEKTYTASSGLRNILTAAAPEAQAVGYDVWAAAELPGHMFTAAAAPAGTSSVAAAPCAGYGMQQASAAAADSDAVLFKRPSTLPTLRSWMDRAAALAAGVAAEGPTAAVDIETIADEMSQQQQDTFQQREQQRQLDSQQHVLQESLNAATASPAQQQPTQQQHQQLSDNEDGELPGESSFQDLLPQQQQQQGQEQQGMLAEGQQQQHQQGLPPGTAAAAQATDPEHGNVQQLLDSLSIGEAAPAAVGQGHGRPPSRGTGAAAAAADMGEFEPQPRALPAALQKQRQQLQPQQQNAMAAGPSEAGSTLPPQAMRRPLAAYIPASVSTTPVVDTSAAACGGRGRGGGATLDPADTQLPQAEVLQSTAHAADRRLQQTQQQQQASQQQQDQENKQARGTMTARERLTLRRQQQLKQRQQEQQQELTAARPAAAAAAGVVLPVNDHPLATAVANSSRLLARKVQEAEEAPQVAVDPIDVVKLAVQLVDLDVDREQQQYQHLPDVRDIPTPTKAPKLVPKQLDARWVASRNLKPQMETLFRPEDWRPANIQPQVLVLPQWPTPQQVVQRLLWPQTWRDT